MSFVNGSEVTGYGSERAARAGPEGSVEAVCLRTMSLEEGGILVTRLRYAGGSEGGMGRL
jgi:hypothetical protein